MTTRIARLLLRLYPRQWRARYHDELSTLVGESPVTVWTLIDLACGVIDAHLHGAPTAQTTVAAPAGPAGPLRYLERLRRPPLPAEATPGEFAWGIVFGVIVSLSISALRPALDPGAAPSLLARIIDATAGPASGTVSLWVMSRRGQPFRLAAARLVWFFVAFTVTSELLRILSGH